MKILHISSRLPWPLIDGARICMHRTVEGLARLGHEIHLVAFDEEFSDPGPLAGFGDVTVVPLPRRARHVGALKTLFDRRPYSQLKREVPAAYGLLDRLHSELVFDVVLADEIHVASYGAYMRATHHLPYVLRTHNVETEIYRRHTNTVRNPAMRMYLELQTSRWRQFEREQMRRADVLAAITERDREMIVRIIPGATVHTVPAAVDLDAFPYVPTAARESNSMVMLGDMAWPPNRDAALWFTHQVLPRILHRVPDAVLYLLGGNPPIDRLPPRSKNLRVEGRVPEVRPYFDRAAVGLIPLRVGGGMRVKMIEMMSSGLPIVSTGLGAEGNEAREERHYLRADEAELFADQVVRLLLDANGRELLAQSGRRFVAENYSLPVVSSAMAGLLEEAVARHRTATEISR